MLLAQSTKLAVEPNLKCSKNRIVIEIGGRKVRGYWDLDGKYPMLKAHDCVSVGCKKYDMNKYAKERWPKIKEKYTWYENPYEDHQPVMYIKDVIVMLNNLPTPRGLNLENFRAELIATLEDFEKEENYPIENIGVNAKWPSDMVCYSCAQKSQCLPRLVNANKTQASGETTDTESSSSDEDKDDLMQDDIPVCTGINSPQTMEAVDILLSMAKQQAPPAAINEVNQQAPPVPVAPPAAINEANQQAPVAPPAAINEANQETPGDIDMPDAVGNEPIEEISTGGNFVLFMAQVFLFFFSFIQDHPVSQNRMVLDFCFFFLNSRTS